MSLSSQLKIYVPVTPAIMTPEARQMLSQIMEKGHVSSVVTVSDDVYKRMIGRGPWPSGY